MAYQYGFQTEYQADYQSPLSATSPPSTGVNKNYQSGFQFDFQFDYQGPLEEQISENLVKITGESKNADGSANRSPITIRPSKTCLEYLEDIQVRWRDITAYPDSSGDWSVYLYDNEGMGEGCYYSFIFQDGYKTRIRKKVIPDSSEVKYNNLDDYS